MKCDACHDDDFACTNDVVPVNVTHPSGRNWGTFWYCSAGIEEDIRRGFVVSRLSLDAAGAQEGGFPVANPADARREAEEALATVAQRYPNGWGSYDTLSICTSALRALLAEPAPAPDAVATFGVWLLAEWWENDCADLDGATVQEIAEETGLWHQVERHADGVECEWCGNDGACGELTEAGLQALDARRRG